MRDYRDLVVWQKSMDLVVDVYRITEKFPKIEIYGIISQMRRSAVSIPSNIAEGSKRGGRKEYRNFTLIAYGSCVELKTQLEIAKRLEFVLQKEFDNVWIKLEEIDKMLYFLQKKLQRPPSSS